MYQTIITAILALWASQGMAQVPGSNNGLGTTPGQRSVIDQNRTTILLANCVRAAQSMGLAENCAVTDPSGYTIGFIHMDNSFLGSIEIAQKKARTTVLLNGQFNSAMLGRMAQPGQSLQEIEETNGGLIAFGGGFPIYSNNRLIGSIGVSGATVPQDEAVAQAALRSSGFQTNSG